MEKKKSSIAYHLIKSSKFSNPDNYEVCYDNDCASGGIATFILDNINIFNSHGVDKIIQETLEYNKKQGLNGSLEPLNEYPVSKDNGKLDIDIKTPKGKSKRFISQSFKLNNKELIKTIIKILNRRTRNRNEENSKIMNLKLAENLFEELENNNKYKNILERLLKSLVKAYNDEKNQKKQIIKVISSYKDLIDEIKRFVRNEKKNYLKKKN